LRRRLEVEHDHRVAMLGIRPLHYLPTW
jgi:hypothetical protein